MSRYPESVRPDAMRQTIVELRRQVAAAAEIASSTSSTVVTGWTDAQPRWVAISVAYTDFNAATNPTQHLIANLPAGTVCTHQWIEPGTLFVSAGLSTWRLAVVKSPPIYSSAGTAKDVDVTTPDAIDQQHAAEHIVSDSAGANDWYVQITSMGGENGDQMSAGTATVHLLLSVPGSTSDDLPHA